jgi:hypothetical protein
VTTDCNSATSHLDPPRAQLAVAGGAQHRRYRRPPAGGDRCLLQTRPSRGVQGSGSGRPGLRMPGAGAPGRQRQNASLYNDSNGPPRSIRLGGRHGRGHQDYGKRPGAGLRTEGDFVPPRIEPQRPGGSEYLRWCMGVAGVPGARLTREKAVDKVVMSAAQSGYSTGPRLRGGRLSRARRVLPAGEWAFAAPACDPSRLRLDAAFFGSRRVASS